MARDIRSYSSIVNEIGDKQGQLRGIAEKENSSNPDEHSIGYESWKDKLTVACLRGKSI